MTPFSRALSSAAFAALLLLAAACGSDPGPAPPRPSGPAGTGPTGSPSTSQAAQPAEVLDFEAQNLAGGVLRGSDYTGKDVAMWFWAPW